MIAIFNNFFEYRFEISQIHSEKLNDNQLLKVTPQTTLQKEKIK